MKANMEAFNRAVDSLGGVNAFARAMKIRQNTVSNWRARGNVPAEYCPTIERLAGVKCEEIRPDVEWGYLRATAPMTFFRTGDSLTDPQPA